MPTSLTRKWLFLSGTVMVLLICASLAIAQADQYKPGEKIEYKVSSYPEKWEIGTYVGATPDGSQPIIREKPNEFFPNGFQMGTTWANIRRIATPTTPVKPGLDQPPKHPVDAPPGNAGEGCTVVMSENDVLSFFQRKFGNEDPWKDARRKERVEAELAAMVRNCGVNFRADYGSPIYTKISKYSSTTAASFLFHKNLGPPTKPAWYIGTWTNSVQSENYRRIIAAKTGFLTISGNGTYTWKLYASDPPAKYVKGKWRAATAEEMKDQGGAGVVLLQGRQGYDWIVLHDRGTTLPGRWIINSDINTRQMRETGYQK